MLREGLAAEFPSAKRALGYALGAIRVSREGPVWAAGSAFGAAWLVSAIGQPLVIAARMAGLRDPASWLAGSVAVFGHALAIAVAIRAGGRRGLLWYAALLGVRILIQLGTALPGFLTFCDRGGDCSLGRLATPYAYLAAGMALSPIAIAALRARGHGPNALLNGAGALSLLTVVTGIVFFAVQPQDPVGASGLSFLVNGGAAFGAGIVLRLRSGRLRPLLVLAGAVLLLSLALAGPFILSALAGPPQPAALYLLGAADALALLIGWLVARAAQRARTTAAA